MSQDNPISRVFGWLLTILGGLWVLLTGGCTLTMILAMAGEIAHNPGASLALVGTYLLIGAVCVAPGAGLLIWGLYLLRRPKT